MRIPKLFFIALTAAAMVGCGSSEIRPVDIYPEDMCAHCRMAVSDPHFAAEIINKDREVFKFDDIGCMEEFSAKMQSEPAELFVKDFETTEWVPLTKATIVETDVFTPMGSGKVAFKDPAKANRFAEEHPSENPAGSHEERQ